MSGGARRRRRRRRLLIASASAVVIIAVIAVAAAVVTGRLVMPGISGKVYPIKYEAEIAAVAEKYKLDPYLLAAFARTESGFDPEARSGAGAVGLMQLLPTTAEWVTTLDSWKGPKNPALTDPGDSLELGACYLAFLQRSFDNRTAVIASYNGGQGNVRKWIKQAGGEDRFGVEDIPFPETKEFVRRVNRWEALFKEVHPDVFASGPGALAARLPALAPAALAGED